jgi:glycosyltransferase involved in cell wall biosynthesis
MRGDPAVCILPRLEGLGGPASFRARLVSGLEARQVRVVEAPDHPDCRAVLVIGGTRRFAELVAARRRRIRVVQRLNGMNWIHRRRFTGVRHFIRAEASNVLLALIRRSIADRIVYQSNFARTWWQSVHRLVSAPSVVIYNGVDLGQFYPADTRLRPDDRYVVLLVEGHLGGGYEHGLENAASLVAQLGQRADRPVELQVVGDVPSRLRAPLDRLTEGRITWKGVVRREAIPAIDRAAHVLFSADLNAACPNSVVEALACGLPVITFATGSLPELLEGDAGVAVPWGSNFWKLEPPDIPLLAEGAMRIFNLQEVYRARARARAEEAFSLDAMVERYLDVMLG